MASKIKNIIIVTVIAALLVLAYIFFIKPNPEESNLTLVNPGQQSGMADQNSNIARDFLTVLLSVKSIKLDDSIFSDKAFVGLHDSSIELISNPANEGRPNPFAPIGYEAKKNQSTQTNSASGISDSNSPI